MSVSMDDLDNMTVRRYKKIAIATSTHAQREGYQRLIIIVDKYAIRES